MREPQHPDRGQLTLVAVLHGLSDPARLEIVRMLAAGREHACTDFHGVGGLTVPTLSHHLRVLREAGLTRTRIDGKRRYVSLRRDDLEWRFPGVIGPVIKAAAAHPRQQGSPRSAADAAGPDSKPGNGDAAVRPRICRPGRAAN
ncbi:MAG TPA: metalloregulator ArsR/SmtB family transcription factor [Streptosporangiaceae bacterium]|jgi:DNA-binding transcriptional ArsR family regulator